MQYQPMQLYIRAGFSWPAQASFFLVCAGDSVGAGYHPRIRPVIITNNLQNLRFYQHSSKNMNENMFCTEIKLLLQKNCIQGFIVSIFLMYTAVKIKIQCCSYKFSLEGVQKELKMW